jgi:hypothetical protein
VDSRTLADLIVARGSAFDFSADNAARSLLLDFRDPRILPAALASDSSRLSSASFQTASYIVDEMVRRDSAAWSLVKLYYAAFYSGHALLRFFGEGCTYFAGQHVARLRAISEALGIAPNFSIDAGLYHCIVDSTGSKLSCVRARGSVGGAHETFWKIFGDHLREVSEKILMGNMTRADAQATYSQIDRALAVLAQGGGYSWLSSVRNELQYRLSHGVWYPEIARPQILEALSRLAIQWKRDPMLIDLAIGGAGTLSEFVSCCVFVVSLCREILWRIAARSNMGARSFARAGPMALLNDLGVTS